MEPWKIVISCEHATNHIPDQYMYLFEDNLEVLTTHEAYDIGAYEATKIISQAINVTPVIASISRLLIDCNRSLHHKQCFSRFSKKLQDTTDLIDNFYLPYRQTVFSLIEDAILNSHKVLHLSIHSFTPILNSVERKADLGILYDPQHASEKHMARFLKNVLQKDMPSLKIRYNYPYKGISDGLVSTLRKILSQHYYHGFEIEFNQNLFN